MNDLTALWPFVVLAWFVGYVCGAASDLKRLSSVWERYGPIRSAAYGLAALFTAGFLVAAVCVVSYLIVQSMNGKYVNLDIVIVACILFGVMVSASFGTAAVSLWFLHTRSKKRRRITVEICDD
jgi:hypothetical protein